MTDYKAESIKPYNDKEGKAEQVEQMFDNIAPAYDTMNRTMTAGIDRRWRKIAVKMLSAYNPRRILDVATGTGDLALLLQRKLQPDVLVGIDLSENMLEIAARKAERAGVSDRLVFEKQDCLSMSFADNSFDAVTVAYGVRNFEHLDKGFAEMFRVLKPGGVLCVIELSTPDRMPYKQGYRFYTSTLIPWIGKLVSKDSSAYTYLPRSIMAVPQGEAMLDIFRSVGFQDCFYRKLTFGVCTIYFGKKIE